MAQITIDFFELAVLTENCIPPRPIARACFWDRLINEIHNELTVNERERLFSWIIRHDNFDKNNEDCQWFYARFNPQNQYNISCIYEGKAKAIQCFAKDGRFYTKKDTSINPEYIKESIKVINIK